jgi:hypothetical protein
MKLSAGRHLAPLPPLAAAPWVHAIPWWAYLIIVLAWLMVYICRQIIVYKLDSKALSMLDNLGSKALDKANAEQTAAIMEAVSSNLSKDSRVRDAHRATGGQNRRG